MIMYRVYLLMAWKTIKISKLLFFRIQQCERGYEHDPKDPTKCRLVCACEECDEEGTCIACPDNTAGPDCSECQIGFYRPLHEPITSPCLPCEKCGAGLPQ